MLKNQLKMLKAKNVLVFLISFLLLSTQLQAQNKPSTQEIVEENELIDSLLLSTGARIKYYCIKEEITPNQFAKRVSDELGKPVATHIILILTSSNEEPVGDLKSAIDRVLTKKEED